MTDAPAFNCSVCGAPAHAGDVSCRYCGAGIATLRCSRCFQMNMAQALRCSGCGSEVGLIVESELRGSECSDCHTPLEAMTEPAGTILICRRCGGQFVEHALLRSLLEPHETIGQVFSDGPYNKPAPRAAQERVHYRPCAVCQQMMNRKNFGGASGVIVDVCAKHGTWFHAGDLPQVLEFVQKGGLVRERLREQERQRLARARERDHAVRQAHAAPLSFDVLSGSDDHSSFARDLLAFIVEVLTHDRRH